MSDVGHLCGRDDGTLPDRRPLVAGGRSRGASGFAWAMGNQAEMSAVHTGGSLTAIRKIFLGVAIAAGLAAIQGCAKYTTPASGVPLRSMVAESVADEDIAELMKIEPASPFPARIAVVRIQASGYVSRTNRGYGRGRYSVVTVRDIEDEASFARISALPMVGGVAPLSRIILPPNLESIKDLRLSAARLKADLVLIYSVDTVFHVEGSPLGPLSLIVLGLIPDKKAFVTSTTSAALVDVRTGFVYGVSEATGREAQRATMWNAEEIIDGARIISEKASFQALVGEFEKLWKNVIVQYASRKNN